MMELRVFCVDFYKNFKMEEFKFIKILNKFYKIIFDEKNPEVIFCGCFGNKHFKYDCLKVLFIGECICPDFNLYDYAIGFDYINFCDRYLRYPLYLTYDNEFRNAINKHKYDHDEYLSKKKFCNFVVSNPSSNNNNREEFFKLLCNYKIVDSGGKFLNNIGGPIKDKYEFQLQYKFSIAFENSKYPGYTTEKIIQAWNAKTIPIYWGNDEIIKEFNNKAFINCNEYDSFAAVIDKIIEIDKNDNLYLKMMKEPILVENSILNIMMDDKYLEEFLNNVVNSAKKHLFKRTDKLSMWGSFYNYKYKKGMVLADSFIGRCLYQLNKI